CHRSPLSRSDSRLAAVRPDEEEFFTFGSDPFETPNDPLVRHSPILNSCRVCHSDSGIHSVQSRIRWMTSPNLPFDGAVEWETARTIDRKRRQPDFPLLRRYWQ